MYAGIVSMSANCRTTSGCGNSYIDYFTKIQYYRSGLGYLVVIFTFDVFSTHWWYLIRIALKIAKKLTLSIILF